MRFGGDGLAVDFESLIICPCLLCQIKEKQVVLRIMFKMFDLFDTHWLCILRMATRLYMLDVEYYLVLLSPVILDILPGSELRGPVAEPVREAAGGLLSFFDPRVPRSGDGAEMLDTRRRRIRREPSRLLATHSCVLGFLWFAGTHP